MEDRPKAQSPLSNVSVRQMYAKLRETMSRKKTNQTEKDLLQTLRLSPDVQKNDEEDEVRPVDKKESGPTPASNITKSTSIKDKVNQLQSPPTIPEGSESAAGGRLYFNHSHRKSLSHQYLNNMSYSPFKQGSLRKGEVAPVDVNANTNANANATANNNFNSNATPNDSTPFSSANSSSTSVSSSGSTSSDQSNGSKSSFLEDSHHIYTQVMSTPSVSPLNPLGRHDIVPTFDPDDDPTKNKTVQEISNWKGPTGVSQFEPREPSHSIFGAFSPRGQTRAPPLPLSSSSNLIIPEAAPTPTPTPEKPITSHPAKLSRIATMPTLVELITMIASPSAV